MPARTAPLAWIDDAHDATCDAWAAGAARPRRCWSRTDPAIGLTDEHVDAARAWAAPLSVRTRTSGGRRKRTGSPRVPTPAET